MAVGSTSYLESALARYEQANPRSKALHERAARSLPGGNTRTTVEFDPFPLAMDRGQGARMLDFDGNERLDFIQNYTALILGHAHPSVLQAIAQRAERGTAFAATNQEEVLLAEELCRRVPSVERVRFLNSGTEATMFAMRTARAFTGRPAIARIEGGYHGTHDLAGVSTHPAVSEAGPADAPRAVADSVGTPPWVVENTVVLPFNNADAAEAILRREAPRLAAVILEPVLGAGGMIPPLPGYLERLRSVTSELGMLLIFDEVISLRVAPGGAQERFGVMPDLTTMGKIIGGGLPVSAFGGRAEVMAVFEPGHPGRLAQGGTYNGNPLGMAAGLAAMQELTPDEYRRLEQLGKALRQGLQATFDRHDVAAQVTGIASLFQVHIVSHPVVDYRSALGDERVLRAFFFGMLNEGIMLASRCGGSISTPMGDAEVGTFLAAADRVIGGISASG